MPEEKERVVSKSKLDEILERQDKLEAENRESREREKEKDKEFCVTNEQQRWLL